MSCFEQAPQSHIRHLLNNQVRHDWFQVSIVIKKTNYK